MTSLKTIAKNELSRVATLRGDPLAGGENSNPADPSVFYVKNYLQMASIGQVLPPPIEALSGAHHRELMLLYDNQQRGEAALANAFQMIMKHRPDLAAMIGHIVPESRRFTFIPANKITPSNPVFLYGREIMEGKLHIVYGDSGVGKSFVTLDYSLEIGQSHDVLYNPTEGFDTYYERQSAWRKHHKKDLGRLHYVPEQIPLMDKQATEQFVLETQMSGIKPKVVVIDTLAWAMTGGDENSAKDMQIAMSNAAYIRNELHTAVVLVHHSGKNSGQYRGSSALEAAADVMIQIEDQGGVIKVSCNKSKQTARFEPRYIKFMTVEYEQGKSSLVPAPSEKIINIGKPTPQQIELLEFLALDSFTVAGARFATIKSELPQLKNIQRILSDLKRGGYVTQDDKGDPWKITESGRQVIGSKSTSLEVNL